MQVNCVIKRHAGLSSQMFPGYAAHAVANGGPQLSVRDGSRVESVNRIRLPIWRLLARNLNLRIKHIN